MSMTVSANGYGKIPPTRRCHQLLWTADNNDDTLLLASLVRVCMFGGKITVVEEDGTQAEYTVSNSSEDPRKVTISGQGWRR
jgi:hypothetical protein